MAKADSERSKIPGLLQKFADDILTEWVKEQLTSSSRRSDLISDREIKDESFEFLKLMRVATASGNLENINNSEWAPVREMLSNLSKSRAHKGLSPTETAQFVFSFKAPLFSRLRREYENNPVGLAEEVWVSTLLLDKLGLYTMEAFQTGREDVIRRQQEDMLELSTPVVKLWDGILALPMIGTLDSNRTQIVMESLLQKIVETGSEIAIIDITGVPTVDTLVAQHLIKTVTAARLMGAECIISGIRPQIAATIVHLGVDLGNVTTKSSLADAFAVALQKSGRVIGRPVGQSSKGAA